MGSARHLRLAQQDGAVRAVSVARDMPITEIAQTLGYNSTWHFSHFFAKATNVSPPECRPLFRHRFLFDQPPGKTH